MNFKTLKNFLKERVKNIGLFINFIKIKFLKIFIISLILYFCEKKSILFKNFHNLLFFNFILIALFILLFIYSRLF